MGRQYESQLRKTALATAITATLGIAATGIPGIALSDVYTWGTLGGPASNTTTCSISPNAAAVTFTMLDASGAAIANSSIPAKGNNQFQTPTCGTLSYDTETQSGSAEIVAFEFFSGLTPAVAAGITVDKIPDGLDQGVGNLLLANMSFDWNLTVGIPVSLAWDAQALLNEMDGSPSTFTLNPDGSINTASALTATGGTPASDGTYNSQIPTNGGYLILGPSPLATLDFNTTNIIDTDINGDPVCLLGADGIYTDNAGGGCMNINPSADITASILVDTTPNNDRYDLSTPTTGDLLTPGIGGNPMQDGPFGGSNANFDFTSMTLTSFTDTTAPTVTMNPHVTPAGTSPLTLTQGVDTYTEPGATCTDAAPLNTDLNASVVIGGDTVDTGTSGTYNVTYDCQDPSSINATTVTREVNVVGLGVPVITLVGAGSVNQECAISYTDLGASCNDTEDGPISAPFTPPQDFSLSTAGLDVNTVATQSVTWSCTDLDNNTATQDRTVDVIDTTDPVITLLPGTGGATTPEPVESSTAQNPATYTDPGASATDTCDDVLFPIPNFSATSGSVNMVVPDSGAEILSYTLSYSQADSEGNTGIESRVVNVTRSQPVITLIGGGVVLNIGDTYTEQGMDITDAQDGNQNGITASGSSLGLTYTIDSSTVDTSAAGNYTVTYNVTDSDGNIGTPVTRDVQVGIFASDSNFTMLDSKGNVFGGTNDVLFDWDQTTNNDEVDYTNNLNFNMTIASQAPWPFFGFIWTAHETRVFGPGTYSFDSGCTVAEIRSTGCPAGSAASSGPPISMTVGSGQFGAHILFDWNTTQNIDVVNVWDVDAAWDQHGDTDPKNQLWNGLAGAAPDPTTDWKLVSTDINSDGNNGSPMVDGPFQGFYANFNAGPGATAPPPEPYTGTAPDTKLGGSLFASPMNPGVLVTVFMTLLGLRRFNKK